MTGAEYRALRERLGWSQQRLAEALGTYQSTIGRRETDVHPIDREAELALRWLVEHRGRLPGPS